MGPTARASITTTLTATALAALVSTALVAAPETDRTISLYHIHTKETLTVTYKRGGTYDREALDKIDWIMRDWRKNEKIAMDAKAIDILWEMHAELDSKEPINIICGYRSRGTNDMLRKTVGGQAQNSLHISGKAIDVAFPDIPAKLLRYSAMIRERGGVGYYPTSAIPFVHVDTSRVRHWPRMGRDELALLFQDGRSKHVPSDGRPITSADVRSARERKKDLATLVAEFHDQRLKPKAPVMVAAADGLAAPRPQPAKRPKAPEADRPAVAAAAPRTELAAWTPETTPAPQLVAAPRQIERPSRFSPTPSKVDRSRLDALVTLAALGGPRAEERAAARQVTADASTGAPEAQGTDTSTQRAGGPDPIGRQLAALEVESGRRPPAVATPGPAGRFEWASAWINAPAYDDDHPDELAYRPFPLEPLMTVSASPDDPALAALIAPDVARTLELIDDDGGVLPMRLRPPQKLAQLMWAQEFRGRAVNTAEAAARDAETSTPGRISERVVTTMAR